MSTIGERVKKMVAEQLGVKEEEVTADQTPQPCPAIAQQRDRRAPADAACACP